MEVNNFCSDPFFCLIVLFMRTPPAPPFFYQNRINMHFHEMHHATKHGLELLCLYLPYVTAVRREDKSSGCYLFTTQAAVCNLCLKATCAGGMNVCVLT